MMSTDTVKSRKAANAPPTEQARLPFATLFHNDLLWSPYRATAKLLLQSERNAIAMLEINRKLADEVREIVRREQDALDEISARMLQHLSEGGEMSVGSAPAGSFTELCEATIEGVREFGRAMNEAHTRSLEVMRESANATAETISQAVAERKAA